MTTTYVLKLVFLTDMGKNYAMQLTGANPSVSREEIIAAMNGILGSNVIAHKNGRPFEKVSADMITTECEQLNI